MSPTFAELAAGARELAIRVRRGDLRVTAGEGEAWTLRVEADGGEQPEIRRDGDRLEISQPGSNILHHDRRMNLAVTVPPGLTALNLATGHGECAITGANAEIRIDSGHGSLLLAHTAGDLHARTGHGQIRLEGHSGRVRLDTGHGRIALSGASGGGEVATGHGPIEVAAGLDGAYELSTGHGSVDVEGAAGRLRVHTGHGSVRVVRSSGELRIDTGRGSIDVDEAREIALDVRSGNGEIRLSGGSYRAIKAEVGRGDLFSSARLLAGTYHFTTNNGDVIVEVTAGVPARVEAQTSHGAVHSDLPLVQVGRSGPPGVGSVRMVGSIGEGEPRVDLHVRTNRGSITVRSGATGASQEQRPPWWRATRGNVGPAVAESVEAASVAAAQAATEAWHAAQPMARMAWEELGRATRDLSGEAATRAIEHAARAAEVAARHAADRVEVAAQEFARRMEEVAREYQAGRAREGGVDPAARPPFAMPAPIPPGGGSTATPEPSAVEAPPVAPPPPAAPPTPGEAQVTATLEALARGEISVEEAQTRLRRR